MTPASLTHDPRTLHERVLSSALMMVEAENAMPPCRARIAALIGEPIEAITAIFPDDRSLLVAGIEQALVLLIDSCTRAVVQVPPNDPVAQFIALGDAYLDWAERHPMQFRLVTDCQIVDVMTEPHLRRYLDSLADLMHRMLTRARDEGRLHPHEDIETLSLASRCFVGGAARMMIEGRLRAWHPQQDSLTLAKSLTRDFVRRMARSSQPRMQGQALSVTV